MGPGVEPQRPVHPPPYTSAADRALGVAEGLVKAAEAAPGGVTWAVYDRGATSHPTDLYTGQAGILAFLAEAYRMEARDDLRATLEAGGRWLGSQQVSWSGALYTGNAGRAWAFLSLHEALAGAGSPWLAAALGLAPAVASDRSGLRGDLISGLAGQGLFILRLYAVTGDTHWLTVAREMADLLLADAVPAEGGIKFPSFVLPNGSRVFYTGMAHGSAGAGYFLCRLARALPDGERSAYVEGARAVARWLDAIARPKSAGVNWYLREPDRMDQEQVQWCHGAPGIGLFYAELHRVTSEEAHLEMARSCAALLDAEGATHWSCCLCHGVAGNAQLYFKLYRETGEAAWLEKARGFGDVVWGRRLPNRYYPAWVAGDGSGQDNPGLLTGTAGVGWFWLQLSQGGVLGDPITD